MSAGCPSSVPAPPAAGRPSSASASAPHAAGRLPARQPGASSPAAPAAASAPNPLGRSTAARSPAADAHGRSRGAVRGGSSGGHFAGACGGDVNRRRLYVGNLDQSVNEYTLLRLFEPFGKITRLDFMFHSHGEKKGQSRGYSFIEFSLPEEAGRAKDQLNKKVLKKRPMVVSYSKSAPYGHTDDIERRPGGGPMRTGVSTGRPSSFSLLKTHKMSMAATTNSKIEALERKLAQMNEEAPSRKNGSKGNPPAP